MEVAFECISKTTFFHEFGDHSVVAAETRWAWEGAVMCHPTLFDSFIECIDGPLNYYSERGNGGTWYTSNGLDCERDGPLEFDFFVKSFIKS